jgi:hypothetical protein
MGKSENLWFPVNFPLNQSIETKTSQVAAPHKIHLHLARSRGKGTQQRPPSDGPQRPVNGQRHPAIAGKNCRG